MPPRLTMRWLERGALSLGLLFLGLWAHQHLESREFQAAASRELGAALRDAEARPATVQLKTAALSVPPVTDSKRQATGLQSVLGRLEIPRLGIRAMVAEGADEKTLSRAVGHIPSTARPGRPGNCGLAGHRDTFLRQLEGVRRDDLIRIVTVKGTYTYEVEWSEVVDPDRVDTLDPTKKPSLTLVTCYPFTYVGHAPQRFVVRARQVEAVEPRAAGQDLEATP